MFEDQGTVPTRDDLIALRQKYAHERDRRLRKDGATQYQRASGEFGYYARDPYTQPQQREPRRDRVEALVIGAGFGGLLTAVHLKSAGIKSVRIMDEAGDVGGTWYWNRYPGIHCDIESYIYMPLLEELGKVPEWRYAPGEEIRQHAVDIAQHWDLYKEALFHTRATELLWDEEASEWLVTTDRGDQMRARYVITSSGTLSQAKLPGIPGIDSYRGHTFHTSRWDYGYTGGSADGGLTGLSDKRVAVVGTGATGLQVIPHVGRDAEHLFVFQRTPSTVDVRDNHPTDPAWAASLTPGWQQRLMDDFLATVTGEPVEAPLINDGWTATARLQRQYMSGRTQQADGDDPIDDETADAMTMNRIRARVDDVVQNAETAEQLKPWYRYMCKRPGFSDTYLQTFNRSNVTLVDTADSGGITRMTPTGIVVGDQEFEVDCVIFATGFEAGISGVLSGTLPVIGRGGRTLLEAWSDGPRTLHGFTTHGFPNFFQLGYVQNAQAVNFAHILHEQARHIAAMIGGAAATGAKYVEPTAAAESNWVDTVRRTAQDTTSFQAECTPGYYNGEGSVNAGTSFGPGPIEFHRILAEWREHDLEDVLVHEEVLAR